MTDLTERVSPAMSDPAYGLPVQFPPAASVVKALGSYFKGRQAAGSELVFGQGSSLPNRKLVQSKASGVVPQAVHRFLNTVTGVHFDTMSEVEKQTVLATLPRFRLEGVGYHALGAKTSGAAPMHRF